MAALPVNRQSIIIVGNFQSFGFSSSLVSPQGYGSKYLLTPKGKSSLP